MPSNISVFTSRALLRSLLSFIKRYAFCIACVINLSFEALLAFLLLQVKAADEAISKAEEQVEKFTEMAKETKVLFVLVNFEWLCERV